MYDYSPSIVSSRRATNDAGLTSTEINRIRKTWLSFVKGETRLFSIKIKLVEWMDFKLQTIEPWKNYSTVSAKNFSNGKSNNMLEYYHYEINTTPSIGYIGIISL